MQARYNTRHEQGYNTTLGSKCVRRNLRPSSEVSRPISPPRAYFPQPCTSTCPERQRGRFPLRESNRERPCALISLRAAARHAIEVLPPGGLKFRRGPGGGPRRPDGSTGPDPCARVPRLDWRRVATRVWSVSASVFRLGTYLCTAHHPFRHITARPGRLQRSSRGSYLPLPRDHVCDCRGERCKRHYGTRHSQQVRSAAATPGHGAGAKRSNGAAGMPHPGIQAAPPPVRSAAARATPVVQTRIRRELAHGAHCYSQLSVDPTATRARLRPLLRWGRAREKCTPRAAVLGKSVHHERAPPHGELLRSIVALFRCSEHATTTGLTGVSVSRHLRPGSAIVRPLEVCAR